MATAVCNKYKSEGVVSPTNMRSGLFTGAALDNLDPAGFHVERAWERGGHFKSRWRQHHIGIVQVHCV